MSGIYKVLEAPALGSGVRDALRDGSGMTLAQLRAGGSAHPGMVFPFRGGLFQVVQNVGGSALAEGDAVVYPYGAAGYSGNLTAASTKAVLTTDDTFTKNALVGTKDLPSWVFITAGTGVNQRGYIYKNSDASGASTITVAEKDPSLNKAATAVPDAFDTAPDATSDYSVVVPFQVAKSAAVTDFVVGVAMHTLADGQYGIIQIAGPALVKCVGSTDALSAGGVVVPSATAGVAKGQTTAGITAAEAARVFAVSFDAYTGAAALRHVNLLNRYGLVPYVATR